MPRGTRVNEYPAPVGGMEWRKGYQKDHHATVLLNADLSKGTLRARKGFKKVAVTGPRQRLHLTDETYGKRYIISIGPTSSTDYNVSFAVYTEFGDRLDTPVNLTTSFNEPSQYWVKCSFVNTIMADPDNNGHNVTLISTPYNTYIYEPWNDPTTVRLVDPDKRPNGDSIRKNDVNNSYIVNRPRGYIAIEHQSRFFYAGLGDGYEAWLTDPVEDDQNGIDEMIIGKDRGHLVLGKQHVLHTDRFDPAGINAFSVMSVEDNEPVVGMKSFQDNLVVLTDQSIYVLTGSGMKSFAFIKADSGHGCAAHNSIIEVGGVLYYMSHDGVYAFGGLAAPQAIKISTPIDALWHGEHDDQWVFEEFIGLLSDQYGWPWRIDHAALEHCNVIHVPHLNQIWWSVPLMFGEPGMLKMTLVFDYVRAAWSVYMCQPHSGSGGTMFSPMFDGVVVRGRGPAGVFTSNGMGVLTKYGHYKDESTSASKGIALVWVSVPFNDEGAHEVRQKDIRLHIRSTGKNPSNEPVMIAIAGDEAHQDMQQSVRQEKTGNVTMHPNESLPLFFFGEAKFDDASSFFSSQDWFLSKFNARVRSNSWRVGVIDDADDQDRGPLCEMKNFSAESKGLGSK